MKVTFIAHAGMCIEEVGTSILIDPWFLDSTPENPVIESIGDSFKTIDFQIPKTAESIEKYAPDAIFVSHFHPHHSPARDINILCKNSLRQGKKVRLGYPLGSKETEGAIRTHVPGEVEKLPCVPDTEVKIGPFTIRALEHSMPQHSAWYITSPTGSLLHIGDGSLNRDYKMRVLDQAWLKLKNLSPSFLFLSSGGHNIRGEEEGKRYIIPAGIFSPVEAAMVTQLIAPKAVGVIGIYNHSIWKNRVEYIQPAALCEEEFQWAVSWLAPGVKNVQLLPGMTFGVGETQLKDLCTTYLN